MEQIEYDGYTNPELIKSIVQKNLQYESELIESRKIPLSGTRILLPFALGKYRKKISVLDFGGGGGSHFAEVRTALPNYEFIWTVLETPEMVRECKAQRRDKNLHFIDSLSDLKAGNLDLVIANSSIQYTIDPILKLSELTKLGAKYLYITRTVLSENERIDYLQISSIKDNGPSTNSTTRDKRKVAYQVNIVPRDSFEKILSSKYVIQLTISEERGVYQHEGKAYDMFGYFCVKK